MSLPHSPRPAKSGAYMAGLLTSARRLGELNLRPFPAIAGEKRPAIGAWQQRATAEPAEVERLLTQHPDCNLAVATGEGSGVFVIDIDNKSADGFLSLFELELAGKYLPPTWSTVTPSGGEHLWFRYPEGRRIGNPVGVRPGLDIRGEGGLVIVPPSKIGEKFYSWRAAPWSLPIAEPPSWLLDLACSATAPMQENRSRPLSVGSPGILCDSVMRELTRHVERVVDAATGTRNDTLFKAAAAVGELVGAGVVRRGQADALLELAADECGLIRDDGIEAARATIDSGLKHGVSQPRRMQPS